MASHFAEIGRGPHAFLVEDLVLARLWRRRLAHAWSLRFTHGYFTHGSCQDDFGFGVCSDRCFCRCNLNKGEMRLP